jgi:hypothetical protein
MLHRKISFEGVVVKGSRLQARPSQFEEMQWRRQIGQGYLDGWFKEEDREMSELGDIRSREQTVGSGG